MNKKKRSLIMGVIAVAVIIISYRVLFIRTVNYNIGGINIPAKYNVLTGKAVPIKNYGGKELKTTVTDRKFDKMGMDQNDVTAAQLRWALFDAWVKTRPEYKGWESDPEVFKKANEEYKAKIKANVQVVK